MGELFLYAGLDGRLRLPPDLSGAGGVLNSGPRPGRQKCGSLSGFQLRGLYLKKSADRGENFSI